MTLNEAISSPIAIIGIGLRLPGGISTSEQFWDLLVNKKDGKCRVPEDRYNAAAFSGDSTQKQKVASEYGYFLDHVNLKAFDATFFSAKRTEVEVTDPQQRLLLEVVWECIENAGQTNLQGTNTGVYVGVFGEDWHNILHRDEQIFSAYRVLSAGDYALANRLSHEYDFRGPSMTIRTACSASLTGLHLACQAIQNGDCENAIVAGSSIITDPSMTLDMSQQGVLSPSGCCKTFDADADGFARGEAVNAILIKPLDKALKDGDPIRAVIRSTAVNSDGKTSHMGSPSTESQEAMIRRAYQAAGIDDFSRTAFFECHGTGTAVGDPLEVAAVGNVFGETGSYIGSVKPNVGHGEGASGLTSIIKAVLSVENEIIPPNINFSTPNPKIPFQKFKLQVPIEPTPWPEDRHVRVSVNSFGIGGANAHVVIDSAYACGATSTRRLLENTDSEKHSIVENEERKQSNLESCSEAFNSGNRALQKQQKITTSPERVGSWWPQILPVSAKTAKSLGDRIKSLHQYIEARPGSLNDVAYTLGLRRVHLSHRSYSVVQDGPLETLEFSADEKIGRAPGSENRIAFVFTGQGAQWVGMGKTLVQSSPSFREDIKTMDDSLKSLPSPPTWSLEALLTSDADDEATFKEAHLSQPLCTAIQIAIVNFLRKSGIKPSAVVGHSSGEIAAAYTAGVITKREAIICACYRGQVVSRLTRRGRMAAVGMGYQAIQSYLVDGAQVGCENSSQGVTISGDEEAVAKTLEAIWSERPDIFTRELHVEVAYHSNHMQEIGQVYEDLLMANLPADQPAPNIPLYSTVSGKLVSKPDSFGPKYWRSNLESPVLFRNAVTNLVADMPGLQTIVEVGPHTALQGPLRHILQEKYSQKAPAYIPTLIRNNDSISSMLKTVGQLYSRGHDVDFGFVNPSGSFLHDLPNYPWDHSQEFWKEGRVAQSWRFRKHAHHELLGSRCPESTDLEPIWRNIFHESDVPWLKDHKVESNVVFPCAGYVAMMGEAVRQMTGIDAYVLRNLTVKAALMLPEMEQIEIRTTMRPARITERTSSSDWFDISISTLSGSSWIENCAAQGRARGEGRNTERPTKTIEPQIRHISSEYLYDRMSFLGLRYGPRFQGLIDISSSIDRHIATALVVNKGADNEARYAAHPTAIDNCLQLYAVAGCNGMARSMDTLGLPIEIRGITVHPGGPELMAEAELDTTNITGNVTAVDSGTSQLVIKLEDTKGIPFDTGDPSRRKETQDLARLEWLPHIDYLDPKNLIRRRRDIKREQRVLCNKLSALGVLKTLHIIQSLEKTPQEHLSKYVSWLEKEKSEMSQGKYDSLSSGPSIWSISSPETWGKTMKILLEEVEALGCPIATNVARIIYDAAQPESIVPIFTGKQSSVESLTADDRLGDFYRFQAMSVDVGDFFRLCAHAQPTLRVLEIGAGTGSTTEQILPVLRSDDGVPMYSRYVFSDISSGFFADAKKRFQNYKAIEYKVLDIEKDPVEQGFELGSFDVIVASNTLHATKLLQRTLCNVRSLLRPGGRLYLDELVLLDDPSKPLWGLGASFIMGRLPGWWNGQSDGRGDVPFVSVERWDKELRAAGFSGSDSAVLDEEYPYQICAHITSTAVVSRPTPEIVIMLYKDRKVDFGHHLADFLGKDEIGVRWLKLDDAVANTNDIPRTQHIVSTIDLEEPFLDEISEEDYNVFISYLSKLKGGILWLTRPAQVACTDPRFGIINGMARTIRIELSLDFWTAEIYDPESSATIESTLSICRKFCAREPLKHGVDVEFFVKEGVVHIGRYHWTSLKKAIEPQIPEHEPKSLVIGQYGLLDSLEWVQQETCSLQAEEVELDVRCVGLNFRDIMVAMGLVPMEKDSLGIEATGVVTRTGSAVQHVKSGDRVFCIGTGLFATRKIVSSKSVANIPDGFTLEQAVTMPIVYATVIYSLISVGQLKKGQSILIHSGTGGVGQAAINICQMLGAEIFVTVGSSEKARYLVEHHNIRRENIFDSHSPSFLEGVRAATKGRGVDVVLNSLSGELLHASWKCVAPCGKMMEIGKRDILEHGQLALDMFRNNRTFYGVDMESLFHDRPESLRSLTDQLVEFSENGHVKPIEPIHTFTAQKIPEAIRFMKKGEHMGKIVITMPEDPQDISASKVESKSTLLSDSTTYIVVGGLGGLGKSVTRWMIEKGARHFCFLSRSAGTSGKDQAFLREIESQGCKAVAVAGSVAEMADVRKAINLSPSKISGVLQMSMVIRDRPILETSYQDWRIVHDCKVKGTWNLHNALEGVDLDFFILMSSISGSVGHPGQANYTSANSFLDSFAQYRQNLGLPCSSINLGGMEGVGFLSERPAKLSQYRSFGLHILHEQHLVDAIQLAMTPETKATGEWKVPRKAIGAHTPFYNTNQHVVGLNTSKPLADPTNRALYKGDPRVALYHNIAPAEGDSSNASGSSSSRDKGVRELLAQAEADPRMLNEADTLEKVSWEVGRTLFSFLLLSEEDLDISLSLSAIGIDSLVSIEIRNYFRKSLGVEITVLEIMNAGTIEGLGKLAIDQLKVKFGAKDDDGEGFEEAGPAKLAAGAQAS